MNLEDLPLPGRLTWPPYATAWLRMAAPFGGNLGDCRWCDEQMTRSVVVEPGGAMRSAGSEICPGCDTGDWDDPLTVDLILSTPSVL